MPHWRKRSSFASWPFILVQSNGRPCSRSTVQAMHQNGRYAYSVSLVRSRAEHTNYCAPRQVFGRFRARTRCAMRQKHIDSHLGTGRTATARRATADTAAKAQWGHSATKRARAAEERDDTCACLRRTDCIIEMRLILRAGVWLFQPAFPRSQENFGSLHRVEDALGGRTPHQG